MGFPELSGRLALRLVVLVAVIAGVAAAPVAGASGRGQGVSSAQNSSAPGRPGYPFVQWQGRGDKTLPVLWKVSDTSNAAYDLVYSADGRQSWTRAASGISPTGCTRQQSGGHNHANSVCFTINGPAGSATGVLDNQATYIVAVRAVKSGESSAWVTSDPFEPLETPRVSAYAMACPNSTDYVMFIRWAELPEPVTHEVRYKIGNGNWVSLPTEDSSTPYHRKIDKSPATGHWVEWMDQLPAQASAYTVTVQIRRTKTVGAETVRSNWGATTFKAGTASNVRRQLTRCPNTPANLAMSAYNGTSATVTWDKVDGPHDYDIRHKAATDANWGAYTTVASPSYNNHTTTGTITGLNSAKAYDIAVRARYWDHSAASDWATIATHHLTASSVTTTTATLTLTGHTGDWWLKRAAPTSGNCTAGESDHSHALTSLTGDTSYTFNAYTDSNCTTELITATFTTPLSPPTGLSAARTYSATDNSDSVALSWSAPSTSTGRTGYAAECSTDSARLGRAAAAPSRRRPPATPSPASTRTTATSSACGPPARAAPPALGCSRPRWPHCKPPARPP